MSMTTDQAQAAATTIVEEFLRHPLAYVTGEAVRLSVDENWTAELPKRPVGGVTSVVSSLTGQPVPYVLQMHYLTNLWHVDWVDVVYDHGWHDGSVPAIIGVVVDALARRMVINPESVQAKRVGDIRVDFRGGGSPSLTDEDEKLLSRYRSGPSVASTLRTRIPVPPGLYPYHGDLP